jgi:methyltransferase, FkbM family
MRMRFFVDCGSFDGDSILSFIENYNGLYKRIYGYEPTPSTFKKAKMNLTGYDNIIIKNVGVAGKNGKMSFINDNNDGNRITKKGNSIVEVVRIDDDINEPITFIKMDIEGAETLALIGAKQHIKRSKPKLAISAYHKINDLIIIPQLIKRLVPEYKLYLQHSPGQFPFPIEYVILAVVDNPTR